jgi:hypothetical protein
MTFVENAGLVLLWPFFSFYFQTLELTKDHKFISKEAASHAAYLLEYLVTGKEEGREHLMSLNKLLCNIPRRQPLAAPVTLTEREKKLSEELLTTAISRWDIIKNTSVEGLRESFLKRKGKIEWTEDKINLTVEPRAYDMLVDKIPWSISVIKLPWIEKALYVKWR